ncbi:TM2 domain-containing protein [Enterococcus hirae]|uniref:TM2 domain-containing protein n=1 Tax=Enterococcus hirae TaxID=1354 RepID=UPI003D6C09B1
MAKIIKLELENVVISTSDNEILRIPYEQLDFKPELHDTVDIYPDGDTFIITRNNSSNKSLEDKININIVNENQQQANSINYVQAGKVVNKIIYIILALFLGGFGIHKFYAGKTGAGILYLILCFTFIPAILAIIDAIRAAFKPADSNGNIVI